MKSLAVVLGRGVDVWDEYDRFLAMLPERAFESLVVVAVNVAGQEFPGTIHHWVSWHAELFPVWIAERRKRGYPEAGTLWTAMHKGQKLGQGLGLPLRYMESFGGSSGLLAAQVALSQAERVVLCGIPMTPTARIDDPSGWQEAMVHRKAWTALLVTGVLASAIAPRLTSMNGWTAELLGSPTRDWLNGGDR